MELHPLSGRVSVTKAHEQPGLDAALAVVGATGKLVSDAQHAALAIAGGCTWVSRDANFKRFEPHGLRWQHLALA